jgi:hypothetical protein
MRERANQDTAFEKGKKEDQKQKVLEIARSLLAKGIEPVIVVETTGLSPDDLGVLSP